MGHAEAKRRGQLLKSPAASMQHDPEAQQHDSRPRGRRVPGGGLPIRAEAGGEALALGGVFAEGRVRLGAVEPDRAGVQPVFGRLPKRCQAPP